MAKTFACREAPKFSEIKEENYSKTPKKESECGVEAPPAGDEMLGFTLARKKLAEILACSEAAECSGIKEEEHSETPKEEDEDSVVAPPAGEEMTFQDLSALISASIINGDLLNPVEEQLQCFLTRIEELKAHLIYRLSSQDHFQNESFHQVISGFLHSCEPYFTYLESTARNSSRDRPPLPMKICTLLLNYSEQICSEVEQLVLLYADLNCLSLEETDPLGISHFCIGQCQVDNIKLSVFLYCRPSPFLALTNGWLFKRMRWNVERERGTEGEGEEEGKERGMGRVQNRVEGQERKGKRGMEREGGDSTEYYFLCCEDVPVMMGQSDAGDAGEESVTSRGHRAAVRMWSIGQWVQTCPDPDTEDICDWVLCVVPQGKYQQVLWLGEEEPSPCRATDYLLEVLSSQAPLIQHSK